MIRLLTTTTAKCGFPRHRFFLRNKSSSASFEISSAENDNSQHKFDFDQIRNEIFNYWLKAEAASPNAGETKAQYCCFTFHDAKKAYLKPSANWHWLDRELSSNLAGETGAVFIYRGALSALSLRPIHDDVLEFCKSHMANESTHLQMFQYIVPDGKRTLLLPIWKIAGFTLGFVPTLLGGSKALYVTVEAVETFVEEHFQEQIVPLKNQQACPKLVELLEHCCEDEVHHKEDAARRLLGHSSNRSLDAFWIKPWSFIVKKGSALAAEIARRI
mmetsp:Transcript_12286/g.18846  ORF Transcript_12286/g.18846 Transcript_12286/m.18846 type:complete len:273 (+) Transcript_12286:115-933(+)